MKTGLGKEYDDLIQEVNDLPDWDSEDFNFEERMDKEKEIYSKIKVLDNKQGAGIKPGRFVYFPVADGYATYLITKVSARTVKLVHFPLGDSWQERAVNPRTGSCSRHIVEANLNWCDFVATIVNNNE